jgi:hypothetical protein
MQPQCRIERQVTQLPTISRTDLPHARRREKRAAHLLMPPLRLTNLSSGSELGLCAAIYRISRDHLLLGRLSTLAGSAVQDDGGKGTFPTGQFQSMQAQSAASAVVFGERYPPG